MLRRLRLHCALVVLSASVASATEYTVYLAGAGTPAAEAAAKLADDKTKFAEVKIAKALAKVAELLAACPDAAPPRVKNMDAEPFAGAPGELCTIHLKIAAGEYQGKGGKGPIVLEPGFKPNSTVRVLGGYDDTFTKRAPFTSPTMLSVPFTVDGKDTALGELYVSGLTIDLGGGNSYDGKTNSLLKGSSAGVPAFVFGYLLTDKLVIADNLVMNASMMAGAPLIRAKTPKAEVLVRNNFFLNNIQAWQTDSGGWKHRPASYTLEGNTFAINWPYNPDPTTGACAAVEMKAQGFAGKVVVKDNIFAHNPGGALNSWAPSEKASPPTEIVHNLFFGNGSLFAETEPGAAAMVVKFGGFKSREMPWNVIGLEALQDEFGWKSSKNVAFDPKVPLVMVKPGFANSGTVVAETSALNDVRSLFGMNKQGTKMVISNFAPRMGLDPKSPPFAEEPKAKEFGVSAARVEQF